MHQLTTIAKPPSMACILHLIETMNEFKVISGGQKGADLIALEEATEIGFETGGTVPKGYLSHGSNVYNLSEHKASFASYTQALIARSKKNVDDSNVTVAFLTAVNTGTHKTVGYCQSRRWTNAKSGSIGPEYRPVLIVSKLDTRESCEPEIERICQFLQKHSPAVVNICGHRDDRTAGLPGYERSVRYILQRVFFRCVNKGCQLE